jgi:hypothetical protein
MKECIIHGNIAIPADHQSAIISEPGESPLNFPTAFITSQFSAIMVFLLFVIATVGANQFDTTCFEFPSQRVTVVTLISNQSPWFLARPASSLSRHSDCFYRFFEELDLRRGRRVQVVSKRNTLAVDHHHPLRALAPLGLTDAFAPFFAGAKLPSTKASDQSNWPFSSSSERKARQASSQISCSSQSLSLRQQVEGLGYRFGKSAQGAPVRSIQRIPSKTLRLSAQGLPPFFDFFGFGKSFSIFSHCSFVNFHRSLAIEKTPFDDQVYISRLMAQV